MDGAFQVQVRAIGAGGVGSSKICCNDNDRELAFRSVRKTEGEGMRFRIATWVYEVTITDEMLYGDRAQEVPGKAAWLGRKVYISSKIPLAQRHEVLLHELRHLWVLHHGRPTDDEGDANSVTSFTASITQQFDNQGGVKQLMRLCSDGIARDDGLPDNVSASPYGGSCSCGTRFSPADIINGTPFYSDEHLCPVIRRTVFPSCGHAMVWTEGATAGGSPNGRIKDPARFIADTREADGLKKRLWAAGKLPEHTPAEV